MYKFGQEIIAADSGTICPVWVAQYGRYIHIRINKKAHDLPWAMIIIMIV